MQTQLKKEQDKLKRLYLLYSSGNDLLLEVIQTQEKVIDNLKQNIEEEEKNISKQDTIAYYIKKYNRKIYSCQWKSGDYIKKFLNINFVNL